MSVRIRALRKLHKLVIHDRKGTAIQYSTESRQIGRLTYNNPVLLEICRSCFKNPS